MQVCKYCKSEMIGEFETKKNKSYFFFYQCNNCQSLYEGEAIDTKLGTKILKSRWYNSKNNKFEELYNYEEIK